MSEVVVTRPMAPTASGAFASGKLAGTAQEDPLTESIRSRSPLTWAQDDRKLAVDATIVLPAIRNVVDVVADLYCRARVVPFQKWISADVGATRRPTPLIQICVSSIPQ